MAKCLIAATEGMSVTDKAKLVPENIRDGVTIFDGTLKETTGVCIPLALCALGDVGTTSTWKNPDKIGGTIESAFMGVKSSSPVGTFEVKKSGLYKIIFTAIWNNFVTEASMRFEKDGSIIDGTTITISPSSADYANAASTASFSEGDIISLELLKNGGNATLFFTIIIQYLG